MAIFDPITKDFYCECGCGKSVLPWSSYSKGHYVRSEETIRKQGETMEARFESLTAEDYKKWTNSLSEAQLVRWSNMRDEDYAKFCEMMSKSSPWCTEEGRRSQSERTRAYNLEHWAKGDHPASREEVKEKARQAVRRFWSDEEKKNRLISTRASPVKLKPNNLEEFAGKLIEEVVPGRFQYNKDELVVGSKIPDFFEIGGRKLIEVFGDYWHNRDPLQETEEDVVSYYKSKGYDCLVLWESDIYYGDTTKLLGDFVGVKGGQ